MALASAQDDADQSRRIDKYGPSDRRRYNGWLRDARLSALAVLQCPAQAQMLSWYQSDTLE